MPTGAFGIIRNQFPQNCVKGSRPPDLLIRSYSRVTAYNRHNLHILHNLF